MPTLVLLRHGQSVWNKENLFTGWTDVGLSEQGEKEALDAGKLLQNHGYTFDEAHTSYLKRAIHTLNIALGALELDWIPVYKTWRLNERHYGALQGENKKETAEKYGEEQVHLWRRSYDVAPPALDVSDERFAGNDPRYTDLAKTEIPRTESLKDTVERLTPFLEQTLLPKLLSEKKLLIAAHGNSLRALTKYLEKMSDEEILGFEIPTGKPLVYELSSDLTVLKREYLS